MLNDEIVKKEIDNGLIQYFLNKGINPLDKVVSLVIKAEDNIKSTNDALSTAKFYKELYEVKGVTSKETRIYDSYDSYKENKPTEIKQSIETNINPLSFNGELGGKSNENDTRTGATGEGDGQAEKSQ